MTTSELIKHHHLERRAAIYIRQSTPSQVLTNQESLRCQMALKERAYELGWAKSSVSIVDDDLGRSGASTTGRDGFEELVSQITLSQVGLLLCYDVSRLARNCTDWYPLLDICAFRKCLVADKDGVYDPSDMNGRMLLGLKGQMAEYELYTIRARLTAGLISKAKRGELALKLPAGLVRDKSGVVTKTPNLQIQDRIDLIFSTFLRVRSAAKTVRFLAENDLLIPRQKNSEEILWKKPSVASIVSILRNPAYAGAFAYGKTRFSSEGSKKHQKKVPLEQARFLIKDKYPSYISWELFSKIQTMLDNNYAEYDRNKTRGTPRPGKALLHGLTYCGECGHKMVVQYKKSTRYICNHHRQQFGLPVCQFIPTDPVDDFVVTAFLQAISSAEIDLYIEAHGTQRESTDALAKAKEQELQRLRYSANLAERQYSQVDPENRLVAAELERRWEHAMEQLRMAEERIEAEKTKDSKRVTKLIDHKVRRQFENFGKKLPQMWEEDVLGQIKRKELLRTLIDKVVIHREQRDSISVKIIWKGGAHTQSAVKINVGSFDELSGSDEMLCTIREMSKLGVSDEEIASHLTERGFRSPMATKVLPSTVQGLRLKERIFAPRKKASPRSVEGFLTVPQTSSKLSKKPHWIYDQIKKGAIVIEKDEETGLFLFPNEVETLKKLDSLIQGLVKQVRFS